MDENAGSVILINKFNVKAGIKLPNRGHFTPEERPNLVVKELLRFFSAE
jgi:pimeloyl-ACP methyl ester carboxylesterase